MERNPFEVLGVSKNVLQHLSSSEAMSRVRAIYRALMMEIHPDKGGDPEEARIVVEAYNSLAADEQRFETLKKEYTRITPVELEISQLRAQLGSERSKAVKIFESLEGYVRAASRQETELTVFNCAPCEIILEDRYKRNWEEQKQADDWSSLARGLREQDLIDLDQSITRIITIASPDSMHIRQGDNRGSFGGERVLAGTLKGISTEQIVGLLRSDDRTIPTLTGTGTSSIPKIDGTTIVIPSTLFARRLIPFFRAELTPGRVLISCMRGEEGVRYLLEGQVESVKSI